MTKKSDIKPNQICFTTLITGCVKEKKHKEAWIIFEWMQSRIEMPDEVSWSVMIYLCALERKVEKALMLFNDMESFRMIPTEVTFYNLLKACAYRKDYYDKTFEIFNKMKAYGYTPGLNHYYMLLVNTSLSGDVRGSKLIFDKIKQMLPNNKMHKAYSLFLLSYAIALRDFERELLDRVKETYILESEKLFKEASLVLGNTINSKIMLQYLRIQCALQRPSIVLQVYQKFKEMNLEIVPQVYEEMLICFSKTLRIKRAMWVWNKLLSFHQKENSAPSSKNYLTILYVCCRSYYINSSISILNNMIEKGVYITDDHVNPLIKICKKNKYLNTLNLINDIVMKSRANFPTQAESIIQKNRSRVFLESRLSGKPKNWLSQGSLNHLDSTHIL